MTRATAESAGAGAPAWFRARDGLRVLRRVFEPAGRARGGLLVAHGLTGASESDYLGLARAATVAGFRVVVPHARGTGPSDGPRGCLPGLSALLEDYAGMAGELAVDLRGAPLFLLGHSLGAAVALALAGASADWFGGIALVNPALRTRTRMGARNLLRLAWGWLADRDRPLVDLLARAERIPHPSDRSEALARLADPWVVRTFSLRHLLGARELQRSASANARRIARPLLLVTGARDAFADPGAAQELLAGWPDARKERLVLPEAGHGAHAVDQAAPRIVAWLEEVAAAGPAAHPGVG